MISIEQSFCRYICPIAARPENRSEKNGTYFYSQKPWKTISLTREGVRVTVLENEQYPNVSETVAPSFSLAHCGLVEKIKEIDEKDGAMGFFLTCPHVPTKDHTIWLTVSPDKKLASQDYALQSKET